MKGHLLLILSQSLIGTGFFFLYIIHVRSIFEIRTHFAFLTPLERESILRQEDALYFSFYKTLTEEKDFWSGYEKLKNVTTIEYPNSVNVLKRFHVLPELIIAYIYHAIRHYTGNMRLLDCWRPNDPQLQIEKSHCEEGEQSMQFYLEFVWVMGGITVLIIYVYGTLLSENIFGGTYAVISYIMFHGYASKIYDRPVARENFAFPIIFLQMFYLCLCIGRVVEKENYVCRISMTIKLTILTAFALLCWQFSSIIFATQILIMMECRNLPPALTPVSNTLTLDYSISQILGNILAYYLSNGNKKYIFAWHVGPAFALLLISIFWQAKRNAHNNGNPIKTMAFAILIITTAHGALLDFLEKIGYTRSIDNAFAFYRHLIGHWSLQARVNFSTSLASCNPDYGNVRLSDLWELFKTLIVKPYCMYGVVMLAKFLRKWRKSSEKESPSEDNIERAKKYVLEDFLEENHISMKDMTNLNTEKDLNACLQLLKDCSYNYERYKAEKSKLKTENVDEHSDFMNDIKKLREQINEINEREKRNNGKHKARDNDNDSCNDYERDMNKDKHGDKVMFSKASESCDEKSIPPENKTKPSKNDANTNETLNDNRRTQATKSYGKRKSSDDADTGNASCTSSSTTIGKAIKAELNTSYCHYFYSFGQMIVFVVMGLSIKKLFFLSFTLGCVIAPTICSKFWYRKQRNLLWVVSLVVFMTSCVDPGVDNIHEEYFPKRYMYANDDLDLMCKWIKMYTEKDAVFAGPIEIIGTVHLTTRRPIVNHAHLEMQQISDRTEHVYSIFSRQQSSDIYNQCSQMKIQYLIISLSECSSTIRDDCDILAIWDEMQPAYRKYPQFCSELVNKNIPSFQKVFSNEDYAIIKMFSQSVQINLKHSKMPEKIM